MLVQLGILQVPCIIGSTIVDHAKTKQILVVIESKKNQYWSDNVGSPKIYQKAERSEPKPSTRVVMAGDGQNIDK